MNKRLILVFDTSVAKIFMAKGTHISPLKVEYKSSDFNIARDREARKNSLNQKGSLPGHYFDPHADIKEQEREEFCRIVLDKLMDLYKEKVFEDWIVVADPKSLGILRQNLQEPLRSKIFASFNKDLTHLTESQLERHIFG